MKKNRATAESWRNRPLPPQHKELLLSGSYSREEYVRLSMGHVPQGPDDKWFIYLDDEWLYFHRASTGTCIFQLQIVPDGEKYQAVKLLVNRDQRQYRNEDDEYDVQLLSFLIDRLLLGRFAPFPQPRSLAKGDHGRHKQHVMGETSNAINLPILNGNRPDSHHDDREQN
jgi:hypothetical protein